MLEKIIPIADRRDSNETLPIPSRIESATGLVTDKLFRPLRDLRISVTDRCNFRCVYCMPKDVFNQNYTFLPPSSFLSFEEITRIASLFVAHGVEKIRLTGGEPLLRKNIEKLIAMLAALKTPDGRDLDLTLTTNGSSLAQKAQALKDAGLQRLTVSLDALDEATFKRMNDVNFSVHTVLNGIDVAHRVGLGPIKINTVVKGGTNDQEIVALARHFKNSPFTLRFIEYMDVGTSNGWKLDEVIPSADVIRRIHEVMPLKLVKANHRGETAERWRYVDGSGEIGVISSVTQAFCQECTRARISPEGKLFTCLFASKGYDLRKFLSSTDAEISTVIAHLWQARDDRYSELRKNNAATHNLREGRVEMSYIGG